jgi:hypothetical protein
MTSLFLLCCLISQEANPSESSVPEVRKSDSPESLNRPPGFPGLDALLHRIAALEEELRALKEGAKEPSPKRSESGTSTDPATPSGNIENPTRPVPQAKPGAQDEEEKRKKLEEEFRKALGETKPTPRPPPPSLPQGPGVPLGGGATLKLLDIAFDLLAAAGTSTASEEAMRELEAGGHDPKNRGFTLQNAELTFSGVVDPYFRGDANIVLQIDQTGATTIELEEAYLTTLELPWNLQIKAGQFFNAFGRLNATHPHTWDFVDQPVINSRVLGTDGYRAPGAQLSWLTPLPFFAEVTGSVQNGQGDTAPYFRGVPGDVVAGRTLIDRPVRSLADMVYLIRIKTSFDPTEEITIVPGISALFGPNATDLNNQTQVYGADFYLKWKPLANDQGWPFVAWQTEAMLRRYQAASVTTAGGAVLDPERTLGDYGAYSQMVWGFSRPWVMGIRYDYAFGERDSFSDGSYDSKRDSLRDKRQRASVSLTYYPSEFSKVRIQYNYDRSTFLDLPPFSGPADASSVFMQFEILFGAHAAHKF